MEEGGTSYPVFGNFPLTSPARPVPPSAASQRGASAARPGLVRRRRARRRPRDRGRGHDRARRLRRRLGRPGRRPDPGEVLRAPITPAVAVSTKQGDDRMTAIFFLLIIINIVKKHPTDTKVINGCTVRSIPLVLKQPVQDQAATRLTLMEAARRPLTLRRAASRSASGSTCPTWTGSCSPPRSA